MWSLQQEPVGTAWQYFERVVSLAAWQGDSVQIGFRWTGHGSADFAIDDVSTGLFQVTGPPANDHCSAALPLKRGSFMLQGVTCYAGNERDPCLESASSCVHDEADGSDVFYRIDARAGDTLYVEADSASTFRPHFYLIQDCHSPPGSCVAGSGAFDVEHNDQFFWYVFPSVGTFYLAVDSGRETCGTFSISGSFGATRRRTRRP